MEGDSDNEIGTVRFSDGEVSYYLYNKDVLASTRTVVAEDGTCVVSYSYSDFGETTTKGNENFFNEICYTGAIYDKGTGLYQMNARYYEPETGRFLSQDSVRGDKSNSGTWNLYSYCANNPIKYIDPSGHSWISGVKSVFSGMLSGAKKYASDTWSSVKSFFTLESALSFSLNMYSIMHFTHKWTTKEVLGILDGVFPFVHQIKNIYKAIKTGNPRKIGEAVGYAGGENALYAAIT